MLKNKEELEAKIEKELQQKAKQLIKELDETSDTTNFTIDTIEDMMTKPNSETNQIVLDTVTGALASFDESEIIKKKKKK